jgi:hypothetical protein
MTDEIRNKDSQMGHTKTFFFTQLSIPTHPVPRVSLSAQVNEQTMSEGAKMDP